MKEELTLDELRRFCRDYDRDMKSFPESAYEGWSVYRYIVKRQSEQLESIRGWDKWDEVPEEWPESDNNE